MVYLIHILSKNGNISNFLATQACCIVVTQMNILELVASKCKDSLLITVKNISIVTFGVEIGNECRCVITCSEGFVVDD